MGFKIFWRVTGIFLLFGLSLQAEGQVLYGTCELGGNTGKGTIFQYFPANDSLAKVFDFGGAEGAYPTGGLIQASDGNLYGRTLSGGAFNKGVLFQYNPFTQQYTKKYDYDSVLESGGGLVQFQNKLYGLGYGNGLYTDVGAIYSYNQISYTFVYEYNFFSDSVNYEWFPHGDLTLFNNKLYGVTWYGGIGTNDNGAIFQYDPSATVYTEQFNFDENISGYYPSGKLTVANNNKLYLTTEAGGAFGWGTILEFDPNNPDTAVVKYNFDSVQTTGSLLLAADGNLYGFADSASSGKGVLFKYLPGADNISIEYTLDSVKTLNAPTANLVQATNGLLYAADSTMYSFDYNTNTYTVLKAFNDSIGLYPFNGLIQVDLTLGIEDVKTKDNLSLYPNPATSEITIQNVDLKQHAVVRILDITGRTLLTNYTNLNGKIVFDIHTLTAGIYLVELKQGNLNYTGRFVKMD